MEDAIVGTDAEKMYEGNRRDFSEQYAVDCLASVLKPDHVYRNCKYVDDRNELCEVDVLIVIDRHILVVEVKGGRLSFSAMRGAPDRLKRNLGNLLTKTVDQASRAEAALRRGTTFRDKAGEVVDLPSFDEVLSLGVTLDSLSWITPVVSDLLADGLLPQEQAKTPTVSLADLELMCSLVPSAAQLMRYLQVRSLINTSGMFSAMEERDFFNYYLNENFELPPAEEGTSERKLIFIEPNDGRITRHLLHRTGKASKKPPAPTPSLPPVVRRLISWLDSERPTNFVAVSLAVLRMTRRDAEQLVRDMQRNQKLTSKDNVTHSISVHPENENYGFIALSFPKSLESESLSLLTDWCGLAPV